MNISSVSLAIHHLHIYQNTVCMHMHTCFSFTLDLNFPVFFFFFFSASRFFFPTHFTLKWCSFYCCLGFLTKLGSVLVSKREYLWLEGFKEFRIYALQEIAGEKSRAGFN